MNALFWLSTIAAWPLLGWLGDLPRNVQPRENLFAVMGQWTSAIFHTAGALIALIVSPLWGMTWGLVAALILARRLCASGAIPVPLRLAHLWRSTGPIPFGRVLLGLGVAAPISQAIVGLPSVLGWVHDLLALLGPLAVMTVIVAAGVAYGRAERRAIADRAEWTTRLATIFGVAPTTVAKEAGITVRESDGAVLVQPVPAAIAARLAAGNLDALDAAVALQDPGLMLDPASDHTRLALVPPDEPTRTRRAALTASGGLLAGEVALDAEVAPAGFNPPGGDLILTAEDLA